MRPAVVGPKEPRGHAGRGFGGAGVVDGVVFDVLRHGLAGVEHLFDAGVGDVAGDDEGAGEGEAGFDGEFGEDGADFVHAEVEVDVDGRGELRVARRGGIFRGGVRVVRGRCRPW